MRYTYCTQAASFPGSSQLLLHTIPCCLCSMCILTSCGTLLFVQYVTKAGQEPGNETMPQERMKITERVVYPHKQVDMPLRLLIWDSSVVTTSSLRQYTLQHGQYTHNESLEPGCPMRVRGTIQQCEQNETED